MTWLISARAWAFAATIGMNFTLFGTLRDEICESLHLVALSALGAAFVASRLNGRYFNNRSIAYVAENGNNAGCDLPYESSGDIHSIDQIDRNALIQREHPWAARISAENEGSAWSRLF